MSSLFFFVLLCSSAALASAQGSDRGSKWQTLSGDAPLVIARGGFSGMFPDSSSYSYQLAVQTGLPNLHVWCDVQLTKDGAGICFPDIKLDNASDIDTRFGKKQNTYTVNGSPIKGWFSVDFTFNELQTVNLKQGIYSRAPYFDGNAMQILRVDEVVNLTKPTKLWLNIQYDAFFNQHNLSMRSFIISVSRRTVINYISSPEVGFLRSIVSQFGTGPTKLIFQFLDKDKMEPSTNQTYGSLMTNLTFIKTFATGILVPKNYILPVDDSQYLETYTSLALDAHKEGLEVFASNFANDVALPYDYSYDPVAEYISFVDNGRFSVDGVLSDFPLTASATIECYSHMGENDTLQANFSIISPGGSTGFYPGCTDKAYDEAVSDGADILECPVQMTSDGVPFCLGSIDLRNRTNVAQSNFSSLATTNRDLNIKDGVFAYSLTWNEIQMLKPALVSPYSEYSLFRNPKANRDWSFLQFRNPRANADGSFLQLSDFLARANYASSISGVLISIENAAYLAEKQGLGVTDAILDALRNSGYNSQTAKRVMIKSSDSAVLSKFKSSGYHDLVYVVDEVVSDILNSTILEMKEFASSVVIYKRSVFPTHSAFTTGETAIVPKLHAFNLSVYVQLFRNEFVSQPWDFFSDAYVEINTYVSYMEIDGVITDYPATAARFRRNRCLGYKEVPIYMSPVKPGGIIPLLTNLPPADAPSPVLTESDVMEPPLPPTMNPDQKTDSRKIIIIAVVVGSVIISICTYFSWKWIAKHRDKKKTNELAKADALGPMDSSLQDALSQVNLQGLPFFKFEILSNATSNFSEANKLGKGGFGSVYKGELLDGREIAVKRLSQASGQGMREFMNEVVLISKLQHRNLVKLLGCCTENNETMLIYEYLPNKSLDFFLFDSSQHVLDWRKRLNIIEGICRGLLYLHRDSRLKIIHRDLKPSNILLDNDYNPKISDFGMARIFGTMRDHASTIRIVGTHGYMAPEYAMEGRFSEKSDVFSFGVLMLEIATGRRNTSFYHEDGPNFYHEDGPLNLLGHVWKLWNEDNVAASIDTRILSPSNRAEVVRCMHIGLLCVQEHPKDRPSISAVLSMLSNETIELPEPKRSAFIITSSHCDAGTSSSQQNKGSFSINNVSLTQIDGR